MGLKWSKKSKWHLSTIDRSVGTINDALEFDNVNLETYTLVWLDRKLETTNDNIALLAKLRVSVNRVRTFTHLEACRMFIDAQSTDEPLVLVISGKCGQELVPCVHNLDQVNSIYVFCLNRAQHITWARSYPKVNTYLSIQCTFYFCEK